MEVSTNKMMFEEFEGLSEENWKEKIKSELKGKAIEDLNWQTEGINIKPFYRNEPKKKHSENQKVLSYLRTGLSEDWKIRQSFNLDSSSVNEYILESLNTGCSSLRINGNTSNFQKKLEGVFPQMIPIYLNSRMLQDHLSWAESLEVDNEKLQGGLNDSLLEGFVEKGECNLQWVEDFKLQSELFGTNPAFKLLKIDGSYFESSGASIVQQLAYSIALGNEYLEHLIDDFTIDDISARIYFEISVGNSYFLEIAKFRALRILWAKIIQAYNPKHSRSAHAYVIAKTSDLILGINDPETNLIRNSQATMAAAIGSCNEIEVLPHDGITNKNSLRLARNIQNLLKEESYLNKVRDMSMGSHYIDKLTYELVQVAWDEFMKIQISGGFFGNLDNNSIQDKIFTSAKKKVNAFNEGSQTMIGENKYLNTDQEKKNWTVTKGHFNFPNILCNG